MEIVLRLGFQTLRYSLVRKSKLSDFPLRNNQFFMQIILKLQGIQKSQENKKNQELKWSKVHHIQTIFTHQEVKVIIKNQCSKSRFQKKKKLLQQKNNSFLIHKWLEKKQISKLIMKILERNSNRKEFTKAIKKILDQTSSMYHIQGKIDVNFLARIENLLFQSTIKTYKSKKRVFNKKKLRNQQQKYLQKIKSKLIEILIVASLNDFYSILSQIIGFQCTFAHLFGAFICLRIKRIILLAKTQINIFCERENINIYQFSFFYNLHIKICKIFQYYKLLEVTNQMEIRAFGQDGEFQIPEKIQQTIEQKPIIITILNVTSFQKIVYIKLMKMRKQLQQQIANCQEYKVVSLGRFDELEIQIHGHYRTMKRILMKVFDINQQQQQLFKYNILIYSLSGREKIFNVKLYEELCYLNQQKMLNRQDQEQLLSNFKSDVSNLSIYQHILSIQNKTSEIKTVKILIASEKDHKFETIHWFKLKQNSIGSYQIQSQVSKFSQLQAAFIVFNKKQNIILSWLPFTIQNHQQCLFLNDRSITYNSQLKQYHNSQAFIENYCRKIPEGQLRPCYLEITNLSKQRLKLSIFSMETGFQTQMELLEKQIQSIMMKSFGNAEFRVRDQNNQYLYCIQFKSISNEIVNIIIFEDLFTINEQAIKRIDHDHQNNQIF